MLNGSLGRRPYGANNQNPCVEVLIRTTFLINVDVSLATGVTSPPNSARDAVGGLNGRQEKEAGRLEEKEAEIGLNGRGDHNGGKRRGIQGRNPGGRFRPLPAFR